MINDLFVMPQYLTYVIEDIKENLDKGEVLFTELTDQYMLPLTYLREVLNQENFPKGTVVSSQAIYTESHSERIKSKVRGMVRAITRPVQLTELASRFKFDDQKLKAIIEQLIKD